MRSILDTVHHSAQSGPSLPGIYTEVLRAKIVWRRKSLVFAAVALAVTLGAIVSLVTPNRYTADAFVHGGFTASDLISGVQRNSGANVGFDALQLVETQSRLLQTHQLARQVVERLGLDRLKVEDDETSLIAWLRTKVFGDVPESLEYQKDEAAARLLRRLTVRTEPRVYLIVVSFSARDPELAALVVNAFVAEFLRSITLQRLFDQRAATKVTLSQALRTFGDKHPQVREARRQLDAADATLQVESSKNYEKILPDAGDKVTLARAPAVPSTPKPGLTLAGSLLIGLIAGVGLALFLPVRRSPRGANAEER
jgi:uncharacterized protein involved in exopolysaccharide biosynthesis